MTVDFPRTPNPVKHIGASGLYMVTAHRGTAIRPSAYGDNKNGVECEHSTP